MQLYKSYTKAIIHILPELHLQENNFSRMLLFFMIAVL